MHRTTVVLLAIIGLWWSCSSTPSDYRRKIFDEKNLPAGVHFNQTRSGILGLFGEKNLKNHTQSFLFYDFPLSGNDSYTYAFKFYRDTLYGMEIGVFTQNPETATALFTEVISTLNQQFSQHRLIDANAHIWYYRDTVSQKNIEIEWRNETAKFGVLTMLVSDIDF